MDTLPNLLSKVFTEVDSSKRKSIEQQLELLSQNVSQMFQNLIQILTMPSESCSNQLKTSASIYLKNFLRKKISSKSISEDTFIFFINIILEISFRPEIDNKILEHLTLSLQAILFQNKNQNIENLFNYVIGQVNNKMLSCGPKEILSSFQIFFHLIIAIIEMPSKSLEMLVKKGFEQMIIYAVKVLEELVNFLSKDTDLKGEYNRIVDLLKILYAWSKNFSSCIEKQKDLKFKYFNILINIKSLPNILIKCLTLNFSNQKDLKVSSLFQKCNDVQIDNLVNYSKYYVQTIANLIFDYISESKEDFNLDDSEYKMFCLFVYPYYISDLQLIAKQPFKQINQMLDDDFQEPIIIQMLKTLVFITKNSKEFYSLIFQTYKQILVEIVFVFLQTFEKELSNIESDAKTFISISFDILGSQEIESVKQEASNVLENICEYIDGSLTFIFNFCWELIEFILENNENNSIDISNYKNISTYKEALQNFTKESLMDISLFTLTIMSYKVFERKELITILDQKMKSCIKNIMKFPSILVVCRLILFFGYYTEILFINQDQYSNIIIKFLIQCLSDKNLAIAFQGLDSLKKIFENIELIPRLEPYISDYIADFSKPVKNSSIQEIFELIMHLVMTHSQIINNEIFDLIKSLLERVDSELIILQKKNEFNSIIINQCWNVIRAIIEQKAFFPMYLDTFEKILFPAYNYLLRPEKIDFDEDLLQVSSGLIKHKKTITILQGKILPMLFNVYEKYKGVLSCLLEPLNMYLLYGENFFKEEHTLLEKIISLGLNTIFINEEPVETNNAEGALLLQIAIISLPQSIMEPFYKKIIQSVIQRINSYISNHILTVQLLNVIFSLFCVNNEFASKLLGEIRFYKSFIIKTLEIQENYKHNYDQKVLILGMTNILFDKKLSVDEPKIYSDILKCLITFLNKIYNKKSSKLAKQFKEDVESDGMIEESGDDSNQTNKKKKKMIDNVKNEKTKNKENKENKANDKIFETKRVTPNETNSENDSSDHEYSELLYYSLNSISTPIKSIDEYYFFAESVKYIESIGISLINVCNYIKKEQIEYLKSSIYVRTIHISFKGKNYSIPRKIIKGKRLINK